MTDLLTPDEVRAILALSSPITGERLCRDYLTLWDRNKYLEQQIEWFDHQLQESERNEEPEDD